jgi:hypothetical protein
VWEDVSRKIVKFFHEFAKVEATVIDIIPEGDGINALCELPDGEYQVTLSKDLSVKAFYRKRPYTMETATPAVTSSYQPAKGDQATNENHETQTASPLKRPVLSNSEKEVLLLIKSHPGITSYEIRQAVDIKFTMLLPILNKLINQNFIQKQDDKYFPFDKRRSF